LGAPAFEPKLLQEDKGVWGTARRKNEDHVLAQAVPIKDRKRQSRLSDDKRDKEAPHRKKLVFPLLVGVVA